MKFKVSETAKLFELSDLANSTMSTDFALVLEAATGLNKDQLSQKICDINQGEFRQALENLKKNNIAVPNEALQFEGNDNMKFILGLNKLLQSFLKRESKEMQQVVAKPFPEEQDKKIRAALDRMGFVSEIKPTQKKYKWSVLNGANQNGVRIRLDDLQALQLEIETTFIVGSDRKLWPLTEPMAAELVAKRIGKTEEYVKNCFIKIGQDLGYTDGEGTILESVKGDSKTFSAKTDEFRQAVYKSDLFKGIVWPTEIDMMVRSCEARNLKCIPIIAECPPGKNRADTGDTYKALIQQYDGILRSGSGISISNQPHVTYQATQFLVNLPGIACETLGRGVEDYNKFNIPLVFDAIAKTIFSGMSLLIGKVIENEKAKTNNNVPNYLQQFLTRKQSTDEIAI